MKKVSAIKMAVGIICLCFFHSIAFADLDPQEMYDDFNTRKINGCNKCIDTSKWTGQERGNFVGEIERRIKANRAFFKVKSWGNADSDSGRESGRNRLRIKEATSNISGACFTPKVTKYKNNDCSANPDQTSRVLIRYFGAMYDTNAALEDDNGVVYASIEFRHDIEDDDNGVKKSKFIASGGAWQCSNDDCSTNAWRTGDTGATDPDLWFGEFNKSNRNEFCVGYDADSHELVFRAGSDERRVNAADNNLPKFANLPNDNWGIHTIEARVDVENCKTGGMQYGHLEGFVDDVKVYRRP